MTTSYLAEPQDDGTVKVVARLDRRTVAVIRETSPGRWDTEPTGSGHIPVRTEFAPTATWQEAAQAVAAWGHNDVEIAAPHE